MKPKATRVPMPEMSEEQKKEQIARFLGQKRESFAQAILFNMVNGAGCTPNEPEGRAMVERSVQMADWLMEKLYPLQ